MSINIDLDGMEKQAVILATLCVCGSLPYVQDKVALRDGSSLDVEIVKSINVSTEFAYPDEELVNEESKKEISYIVYISGRKEECNQTLQASVINGKDDWGKAVVIHLASDVEGPTRVGEVAVTSNWGGTLGSGMGYKDVIKRLKKKAAKLGVDVILVVDRTNKTAVALGGGVQIVGVAYK